MVQMYDHRAASVVVNPRNVNRPAQPLPATDEQHADPAWLPTPQFWIKAGNISLETDSNFVLGFKEITAPTNARTMIASLLPRSGFGNKVPVLDQTSNRPVYVDWTPLLLSNLNSVAFDFVARQKVHGQTLNLFLLEQLPVIPPDAYARRFGAKSAAEIVREEVLALTYTAHDLAPFAKAMGHVNGAGDALPPYPWDEADRLRRRAKLDALYFLLYFPSETANDIAALRETAAYIYSTFPIVEREERAAHGRYLSRDLCLAWINALAAGDPDADIQL